jgi:Putative Flp pilus-assembly TadE/G-like
MTTSRNVRLNERGAVLVHVAVVLVGLIAFTAFAFDYGVMFVSRREAQNAADAGALAAATSLTFANAPDQATARAWATAAAVDMGGRNAVWGTTPDIQDGDVTYPACPPGAPGVPDTCVRVNVFRTTYEGRTGGGSSPLPTFFANLVGVNEQGVRATATAQMLAAVGTADCVKPWGLPDKWIENLAPTEEFNRYYTTGPNRGEIIPGTTDVYDPAQGYMVDANDDGVPDAKGTLVRLYTGGSGNDNLQPGFFQPVVIVPGCTGASCYQDAIEGCATTPIVPGMTLQPEPGRMVGPTGHGFENLIAQDPDARWNTSTQSPEGGCMAARTCGRSPRWIAVPIFDVDAYDRARLANDPDPGGGRNGVINVVGVIGLWLEEVRPGNDIMAYITHYPTLSLTGGPVNDPGAFARMVILVR